MAEARAGRRVFNIAPGVPFLRTFVRSFLDGAVIPGFPAGKPLALPTATIFVPTARAAKALAGEFLRASGRSAALLPAIVPLGRLESLEPVSPPDGLPPMAGRSGLREIGDFERRMTLAILIRKWASEVDRALAGDADPVWRAMHGEEPLLLGSSFGSAWTLAAELAALIDDFAIEGADWSALEGLAPGEFDQYWEITHRFLKIAGDAWPRHLHERGIIDQTANQIALVNVQIERMAVAGASGPMIVLGSTGANAATARLLAAIAKLANGAVVLPGVDSALEDSAWGMLTYSADAHREAVATHPQTAMARLLLTMDVARSSIVELGLPDETHQSRNRLLNEAFRPAETTDRWFQYRSGEGPAAMRAGLDGIATVTANDEREEALCIAIKLRECIHLGRRAALIAADRDIARRVRAQLGRWDAVVVDSGGETLARLQPGSLAALLLFAASREAGNVNIAAALAHPLMRLGFESQEYDRLRRMADMAVLRAVVVEFANLENTVAQARKKAAEPGAHPNVRALTEEHWDAVQSLFNALSQAVAPLSSVMGPATIEHWALVHAQALEAAVSGGEAEIAPGWGETLTLLSEMQRCGAMAEPLDFDAYCKFFATVLSETSVRSNSDDDSAIQILGLLEARLLHFDTVVVAGLDEGIWPPKARNDAFLNRAMRATLGLASPDWRIGQTAHDLSQALGAPDILIVRTQRRDGAPTVPSRFIQRIEALAGETIWSESADRGARFLSMARSLDERPRHHALPPAPRPPLHLRPTRLSVTRIETLRRDPYSIYAERILRLLPVDALVSDKGFREFGIALHETVFEFSSLFYRVPQKRPSCGDLTSLAREKFATFFETPGFQEFAWPRLIRILNAYYSWEVERANGIANIRLEQPGVMRMSLSDGSLFELTARADRIEIASDGSHRILDFKSGRLPTGPEIHAGFAPQLVLEAGMLADGAFGGVRNTEIDAIYIKLGGSENLEAKSVGGAKESLPQLMQDQFAGLRQLLDQLRLPETAFVSRPYPQFLARFGDYDHLARVKEWSAASGGGDAGA